MLGGDAVWEKFDKGEKKKWRKIFKVVFLAVAYRMSAKTLGTNLNVPENEAQGYIDALFSQFPILEKFIIENSEYPINHDGYINTELGDTLRASSYRYLMVKDKWGREKKDNRVVAKLNSAGINYRIQSFSALSLASGFANVVQKAKEFNTLVRNIIVVHDSCENLCDINKLFEMRKFYDTYFHKYALDNYGISFDYDLEIGVSYGEMLAVKMISDKEMEISGTGSTLNKLLYKIYYESDLNVKLDIPIENIQPKFESDSIRRFISEHQCCMEHDDSKYTIILTKLDSEIG